MLALALTSINVFKIATEIIAVFEFLIVVKGSPHGIPMNIRMNVMAATFLLLSLILIVWVNFLYNFRSELPKTYDMYSRVLGNRSSLSDVDFHIN